MDRQAIRNAFAKFRADKGFRHKYDQAYAAVYTRMQPTSILEIGIQKGRSLLAWRELFPDAQLTGVDIQDGPFDEQLASLNFTKVIASSTVPEIAQQVADHDIVIDDGDHSPEAIMKTFDHLYSKARHFYIIEDIAGMRHERAIRQHIRKAVGDVAMQTFDSAEKTTFTYAGEPVADCFKLLIICKNPDIDFSKV